MTKRAIYWAIMCTFMAIITIICGLTIVHSSKVATLTLDQTVTYEAPEYIAVTFDAGEGYFSDSKHTYSTTIKISTLSGTSIFPSDPTLSGYTFAGWEYSVDGTNYSDYALASDMPFTDHLYVRAKWEEVTFTNPNYFTYSVTDGKATITGLSTAGQNASLTEIIFPSEDTSENTVVMIGSSAFANNTTITSITIPSSVTSIGSYAFYNCTSLTSITIPSSVTSIGSNAFTDCSSLTSVTFENPNGWWRDTGPFSSTDLSNTSTAAMNLKFYYSFSPFTRYTPESYFYWNDTTLVGFSFDGYNYFSSKDSTDIVIPPMTTAIGSYAFYHSYWTGTNSHTGYSSGVTSVTFAGNIVTSIGNNAFNGCTSLTSITIPDSVTSIGNDAFRYCRSLSSVVIESSTISIGMGAFAVGKYTLMNGVMTFAGTQSYFENIIGYGDATDMYGDDRGQHYNIGLSFVTCDPGSVGESFELCGYFDVYFPNDTSISSDTFTRVYHGIWYCFTSDTEVECWDEKRKRRYKKKVKDLKYSDLLIVWNFDEGKFDTAHPLWISKTMHATCYSETIFEDGRVLKVVGPDDTRRHRLFNMETGKFEYIGSNMKAGTRTFTVDGVETKVKSIRTVYKDVEYYNVISNYHMNLFTSGILTSCRLNNLYDVKDMKFVKDDRKLHSREDFAGVSDRYFDGLRLAEQSLEINKETNDVKFDSLVAYAQHLEESAKEDKE